MTDEGELEKVQFCAALNATGLPFFFLLKQVPYLKTGWGTLQTGTTSLRWKRCSNLA